MVEYVQVYRESPYSATKPGIYADGSVWYCREVNGGIWILNSGMNVSAEAPGDQGPPLAGMEKMFLRALAVAQDPKLAKELTDG